MDGWCEAGKKDFIHFFNQSTFFSDTVRAATNYEIENFTGTFIRHLHNIYFLLIFNFVERSLQIMITEKISENILLIEK